MGFAFRVGNAYRDRAGASFEDDEFLRWLQHEKTIGNAGGVRWRDFLSLSVLDEETSAKIPAYMVFVTVRKRSQYQNPWEDIITAEEVRYWGDAKTDSTKSGYAEFRGNRRISAASRAYLHGKNAIPPVLHFTKFEEGWVHFTGLCWMQEARVEHFSEGNKQVENLVSTLRILDVPEVSTDWLKERSAAKELITSNASAPREWLAACEGAASSITVPAKPYTLAIAERAVEGTGWSNPVFDPKNLQDGRSRTLIQIFQRQGQAGFRSKLLQLYGSTCAVTGCTVVEILEACHISPYRGAHTNDPRNGVLLRSDIHTLFDQGLMSINPDGLTVALSSLISNSEYKLFHGQHIRLPVRREFWPNTDALRQHYDQVSVAHSD